MRGGIVGVFLVGSLALAGTDSIVLTALTYMERPYQFGANELYRMDCSAFVKRVFEVNGISLPRSTAEQAQVGVPVSLDEIRPGDLLFFSTYRPGPSHVGIYIGNGKMVHASESRGITIDRIDDPYWQRRFLFAKRVTKDNYVVKTYQKEEMQKNRDEIADLIFILSNR
ncbi:MAG TPA: NlpC/P60 family protein [Aquificaceae bacterium]|nr:NlpC/P60 family protein [Aquificaceae bacterium]